MKPSTKARKACEKAGIEFKERSPSHFQFIGKLLVNYYPTTAKAYVAATKQAKANTSIDQAVAMASQAPDKVKKGKRDSRNLKSRKERARLIKAGKDTCLWCGDKLTLDDSTLEHVIPLSRGGLDNRNNMGLACRACNERRGDDMPEIKGDL